MSAAPARLPAALLGRTFLHPALDYLLIGGGLSLVWIGALSVAPAARIAVDASLLVPAIFVANCTHFAASTVRLYAKPGAAQTWPFLTMVFPLLALAVLSACLLDTERLGFHLQALYLTWSPYHYAAQAYGLALMYAMRSGCRVGERDKRWLRWICLLPFLHAFLSGAGQGLDWLLPGALAALPGVDAARRAAIEALRILVFVAPVALYARVWRSSGRPLPLISLLVVVANGVWWALYDYFEAFLWATVFHGVQYLAIVMIFHVKDRTALPGNRHGAATQALWFYAVCLLLAYGLFKALPLAYVWAGFGRAESVLLVIAAINLHHFVVDAYIWRFSKGGSNRRVVEGGLPAPA